MTPAGSGSPELTGVERRKLFTLRSRSLRSIRQIVTADDLAAIAREEQKDILKSSHSRRSGLDGTEKRPRDTGSRRACSDRMQSSDDVANLPRVNIDGPFPTATGLAAAPRYFRGGVLLLAAGVGATPLMALLR